MSDTTNRDRPNPPTSRLAGAAGLTAIGLVVIGLVRVAARVGAGVFFGPEGLAVITAALAIATIATIPGALGFTAGITKLVAELRAGSDRSLSAAFSTFVARSMTALTLIGTLAAAGYGSVAPALASEGLWVAVMTGMLTLTYGSYLTGKAIAYGDANIAGYLRRELIGAAVFVGLGLTVVAVSDLMWVLLPLTAAYLGVGSIALGRLRGPRRSLHDLPLAAFVGYGIVGVIGSAAGIGFTYVTPLVAGGANGLIGIALIGAILTIVEPLYLVPRAVNLILLPRISYATASGLGSEVGSTLYVATAGVTIVTAPILAMLFLERDRILQPIFSDDIVGGSTLGWFVFAVFVSVIGAPAITALAATDLRRATIPMISSLIGFAAAIAVWFATIGTYGTAAVAAGYAIGSVIQVAPPITVATVRYRPGWIWMWARIGALTVAVGAIGFWATPGLLADVVAVIVVLAFLAPEIRLLVTSMRAPSR